MNSLAEINQRIAQLEMEAKRLTQRSREAALETITSLMIEHDIHIAAVQSRVNAAKPKAATRYQDPDTGKTWTGRGAPPKWLREKEAAGRSRDEFAV